MVPGYLWDSGLGEHTIRAFQVNKTSNKQKFVEDNDIYVTSTITKYAHRFNVHQECAEKAHHIYSCREQTKQKRLAGTKIDLKTVSGQSVNQRIRLTKLRIHF